MPCSVSSESAKKRKPRSAAKKPKSASKPKPRTAAKKHRSSGGGFVSDVSGLAIPLGLIAAREGISALYKKRRSSKTSASSSSSPARKSTTSRRRRAVGGGMGMLSPAPLELDPPSAASGGASALVPLSATPPVTSGPMAGGSACPSMAGGSSLAARHAVVAEEFRRMASEIGSFLRSKNTKLRRVKPAAKKKTTASKKKTTASKKKTTASKKPKRSVGARRGGGGMTGGFFDAY